MRAGLRLYVNICYGRTTSVCLRVCAQWPDGFGMGPDSAAPSLHLRHMTALLNIQHTGTMAELGGVPKAHHTSRVHYHCHHGALRGQRGPTGGRHGDEGWMTDKR